MFSSSPSLFADQVRDRLADFEPVSLETVGPRASQDRCDTKFLLSHDQLLALLDGLHEHYTVLEIDGSRVHRYRTLYFDTAGFDLYQRHQRSSRTAFKVRSRHYVDSGRSFFELKRKVGPRRSLKARTETPVVVTELTAAHGAFLAAHAPINGESLHPTVWNQFERITLVSQTTSERVTLDLGIQFEWQAGEVRIPGVVVCELKQERFDRTSAFFLHMRSIRSRPTGFSKYCVGAALLHPQLKRNRARPKLRMLATLAHGKSDAA
jgi:hypothetical protein